MINVTRGQVRLMLLILLLATGVTALSGCTPDTREKKELNLAHFFPATHPVEEELVQKWAAAIEDETGDKISITSYPGETLLDSDQIYRGVEIGAADMGLSCFSYNRGRFPTLEAFELPGIVYENSRAASRAAWEGIKELNPDEVQDTRLLMVWATGPGELLTTRPVHSLEDLQGMDIRATGLSAKTLEALDANPSARPQADAYEGLSRGVIEGNLAPAEVLEGWRQAEVTGYLTETPFLYNTLFYITINKDTWHSLDEQKQEIIVDISEEFQRDVAAKMWDQMNRSALEFARNETGQEIIELDPNERGRWKEKVEPIQEDYLETMESRGLPGEKALNTAKEMAEKYNQKCR